MTAASRSAMFMAKNSHQNAAPLPAGAIIGAAEADLKLRRAKKLGDAPKGAYYAFHRDHVAKATTPIDLINAALEQPDIATTTAKVNTFRIYSSKAALQAAREKLAPFALGDK